MVTRREEIKKEERKRPRHKKSNKPAIMLTSKQLTAHHQARLKRKEANNVATKKGHYLHKNTIAIRKRLKKMETEDKYGYKRKKPS